MNTILNNIQLRQFKHVQGQNKGKSQQLLLINMTEKKKSYGYYIFFMHTTIHDSICQLKHC